MTSLKEQQQQVLGHLYSAQKVRFHRISLPRGWFTVMSRNDWRWARCHEIHGAWVPPRINPSLNQITKVGILWTSRHPITPPEITARVKSERYARMQESLSTENTRILPPTPSKTTAAHYRRMVLRPWGLRVRAESEEPSVAPAQRINFPQLFQHH